MTFAFEHVTLTLKQLSLYILSLYESQPVKNYTVTHCNIMMCNMTSLSILDLWSWCCEFDLGMFVIVQFQAYIKASIVKMDRVTHVHIKLCINFDSVLWPWHWKACPCQLSVINVRILKMDIATIYLITLCNKVTWNILFHLNIYILNDAYINMQLQ